MADVFISYHRSAKEIAGRISAELENSGISCWYETRDIAGGEAFPGDITRAIRECKVFVLILNREAAQSRYNESETRLAFRRIMNYENLVFLPFRVEESDYRSSAWVNYYLRNYQVIDGCPPDTEHVRYLVSRIARIVRRERPQTEPRTAAGAARP